ncbi:Uncharacterized protein Adt_15852 [Abeliophyllum distichum]|uniref:CCHC-type domain-containing protein n=1 Tax=Abeliophyllum distichum TaxID=126358 RepID=A0ABD1U4V0_9LAMI
MPIAGHTPQVFLLSQVHKLGQIQGLNPLTPPYYTKKAGRPKKSRRKEAGEQNTSTPTPEAAANATPSTSGNLSRKGLTMRCKKCGQAGHNKRSCKGAPPPATNM